MRLRANLEMKILVVRAIIEIFCDAIRHDEINELRCQLIGLSDNFVQRMIIEVLIECGAVLFLLITIGSGFKIL